MNHATTAYAKQNGISLPLEGEELKVGREMSRAQTRKMAS